MSSRKLGRHKTGNIQHTWSQGYVGGFQSRLRSLDNLWIIRVPSQNLQQWPLTENVVHGIDRCATIRIMIREVGILYTVWPEILAGNLFWRIGGFESNPPIFHPPKLIAAQCDVIVIAKSYQCVLYILGLQLDAPV